MTQYEQLTKTLGEARRASRITLSELGEHLGVTKQAVKQWETGDRLIPPERFRRLNECLGYPIREAAYISALLEQYETKLNERINRELT